MTEDEGAVAKTAVDEIVPIDSCQMRPCRALHIKGEWFDCPDRAADTAGHKGLCPCK